MPNDASLPSKRLSDRQNSDDRASRTPSPENDDAVDTPAGDSRDPTEFSESAPPSRLDRDARPPLPPRPTNISLVQDSGSIAGQRQHQSPRAHLLSRATTAVSKADIQAQPHKDSPKKTLPASGQSTPPQGQSQAFGSIRSLKGLGRSDAGDTASIRSFATTVGRGGDNESLLGEGVFGSSQDLPTWRLFSNEEGGIEQEELDRSEDEEVDMNFYREFDTVPGVSEVGQDEGSTDGLRIALFQR